MTEPGVADPAVFGEEPWDSLVESRGWLVGQARLLVVALIGGVLLLALPGSYLTYGALSVRAWGVPLVLLGLRTPAVLMRIRGGGFRMVAYADRLWFSSRRGDAVIRWDQCGPFRVTVQGPPRLFVWLVALASPMSMTARRGWRRQQDELGRVVVYALVERGAMRWPRVGRRSSGSGWNRTVLPSLYGMTPEALASRLNHLREAALAAQGQLVEPSVWRPGGTLRESGRAPRTLWLLTAGVVVAGLIGLVTFRQNTSSDQRSGPAPRQQSPCASARDAVRDINAQLALVRKKTAPTARVASALQRDAHTLSKDSDTAPATDEESIEAVALAVTHIRTELVSAPGATAGLAGAIKPYRVRLTAFYAGCSPADASSP